MVRGFYITAAVAVLASASVARADLPEPAAMRQVNITEHLGQKIPLDLSFVDQNGKQVKLGDYFAQGKPVVLSLVYFRCPMLCSLILSGEAKVMREMGLTLGKDYQAVTVSFDPHDGPKDAAEKQHGYLQSLGQPDATSSWSFLTGQSSSIEPLTRALGFEYYFDETIQQFAHPAAIFIISPNGQISRYLYQLSFQPKQLKLALVEAAQGKAGSSLDRALLTCYRYDFAQKKYTFYIWGFIRGGALLGLAFVLGLLGTLWYREFKKKKPATQGKLAS